MKTKTTSRFKTGILLVALFILSGTSFAQKYEASKNISKSAIIPKSAIIDINNQSGDLSIITTNDNKVLIHTTINVTGRTQEDVDKIIEAINNFEFKLSGNTFYIDTRFWKNMKTINGRSTMELNNGETVKFQDYSIHHELHIPATTNLILNNKYSDVDIQSFKGDAQLTMYNGKLKAESFTQPVKINLKYSKAELKNLANVSFELYDSDITIEKCSDVKINSKYSSFEAEKTGNLNIDSYDDNYTINTLENVSIKAKYSDFIFPSNGGDIEVDLYDSNIKLKSVKNISYSGKYSELVFGDASQLIIGSTYDDNIRIGNVKKLSIDQSKYSEFRLGDVGSFKIGNTYDDSFVMGACIEINIQESKYTDIHLNSIQKEFIAHSYDCQFYLNKIDPEFSEITVDGKYGEIQIGLPSNSEYRLFVKSTYFEPNFPNGMLQKQVTKDHNTRIYDYSTPNYKGTDKQKISLEGYSMKMHFN